MSTHQSTTVDLWLVLILTAISVGIAALIGNCTDPLFMTFEGMEIVGWIMVSASGLVITYWLVGVGRSLYQEANKPGRPAAIPSGWLWSSKAIIITVFSLLIGGIIVRSGEMLAESWGASCATGIL